MKFPPKLTRRQMLLGGFFGGATLSLSVSHLRHHRDDFLEQVQGAQLGFEMHTVADKLPELESQPPLVKPTEPYDSEAAILLVRCCRLATEQYTEGKDNPDYQGEIDILPSYQSIFDVADQLAAFQAPTQASLLTSLLNKTLLRDAFKRT
ncbi:MAG: lipase family protein, partial [Cyanobacteria bacterium P01_H01_bin.15]